MEVKVIKKNFADTALDYDNDRAVTDFRAFEMMAVLHAERVTYSSAKDEMISILDNVRNRLLLNQIDLV